MAIGGKKLDHWEALDECSGKARQNTTKTSSAVLVTSTSDEVRNHIITFSSSILSKYQSA